MALTCPNCGNDQNFLVKTLQMHVVRLDDARVEVTEESRPAVFEVLCDECETGRGHPAPRGPADDRRPLDLPLLRDLAFHLFEVVALRADPFARRVRDGLCRAGHVLDVRAHAQAHELPA